MKRLLATLICWLLLYSQAWAAISIAENTGIVLEDNDADGLTSFDIDVVPNQLIVVPVCGYHGGDLGYLLAGIDDSEGLTWGTYTTSHPGDGGTHANPTIAYAYNPSFTGTITITLTHTDATGNYIATGAATFDGVKSSGFFDQSGENFGRNTSVDASVSADGATAADGSLVVAVVCIERAGDSDIAVGTATTSYTNLFNEPNAAAHETISADWKTVAISTPTANWSHDDTDTDASDGWNALLVTFLEEPAVASANQGQVIVVQ